MAAATIEALGRRIARVADGHQDVIGVYLFGSVATGEGRADSDVDVGVLFAGEVDVRRRVRLQNELSEALEREVDLVDLGSANAFVALDAIRGERVFERDGLALDEFDLYVMRRAGDLAPWERERRRQILEGA